MKWWVRPANSKGALHEDRVLVVTAVLFLAAVQIAKVCEPPQITYNEIQPEKFQSQRCYQAVQFAMRRVGVGHAEELNAVRSALIGAQSALDCRYLVMRFDIIEARWQTGDMKCETIVSHYADHSRRGRFCNKTE